MSLSRHEGLRCQNVMFCPFCLCGESQLNLHLLFWPFGCLKEEVLFWAFSGDFCASCGVRRLAFFLLLFEVLFQGADKKASSRGILNENKNQLGHGLVTIWGTAVWRSERKESVQRWLEWLEKAHTNQICSGVFFEDKNYGFKVKHRTLGLH